MTQALGVPNWGASATCALGYAQHTGSSPRPGRSSARWVWPAQRPGMVAKHQVSAAPVGAPPAWHLGPASYSLTHASTK